MEQNYYDTFISVAIDCPAVHALIPPEKKNGKTKAAIEYELLSNHPYAFTQEELLFEVHARHKSVSTEERPNEKAAFFEKSQPCLRSSMLPKKYGWGIHFNSEGKAALVPLESREYQEFLEGKNKGIKLLKAMRNKREII